MKPSLSQWSTNWTPASLALVLASGLAGQTTSAPADRKEETITWAYLRLLQHVRQQHPGPLAADELAGLVNESLRDRTLLTRYYSTELLASPEARRRILAPDRNPLPR